MLRNLTDAEIEEFLYGNPDAIDRLSDTNKQGHLLAYNKDYEFPSDNLEIRGSIVCGESLMKHVDLAFLRQEWKRSWDLDNTVWS